MHSVYPWGPLILEINSATEKGSVPHRLDMNVHRTGTNACQLSFHSSRVGSGLLITNSRPDLAEKLCNQFEYYRKDGCCSLDRFDSWSHACTLRVIPPMGTTFAVLGYNVSNPNELSRSSSQDMAVPARLRLRVPLLLCRPARKLDQNP